MIRAHVIISNGQSNNPQKRELESTLAERIAQIPGVSTLVVPNLYDLSPTGNTIQRLKTLPGDLIVLSWLYDRAAHWTLDRNGVLGNFGETELFDETLDEEDEDAADAADEEQEQVHRVADDRPPLDRTIYCLDLRKNSSVDAYLAEVERIVSVAAQSQPQALTEWLQGTGNQEQMNRYLHGEAPAATAQPDHQDLGGNQGGIEHVEDTAARRWYPVIDFSRCTNCMECIDFCLFGVYGVDGNETILVEQADNCRKGCPACSRVCPENAIIFPQHKTPAIAGALAEAGGLKIDLTQLFGGGDGDALQTAASERDEQLALAGRETVGMTIGIPKRQSDSAAKTSDELDDLVDELDSLDL